VLSGRYFWQTGRGAILQPAVWDDSIPTFPFMLEDAGYHIGYAYKVWKPGSPLNAPIGGERTRYEVRSWFGSFSQKATSLVDELGVQGAKQEVFREVRENFDAFMDARPENAPFFYWWGPTNTHRRWEKGSGKGLWGIDPDDLEGKLPEFLPDVPEIREDVADYLGECMAVDGGLGILMDELQRRGELENTLVVVSGDHGIPGMPRGKCNLYDIGTEVALAARWPGHIPENRTVEDRVNIMDLAPTFLEAAGEQIPDCMAGCSLMPLLRSEQEGQVDPERTWVVTGRERHVAGAREGNLPYPQRAIRTHDYLYIRNFVPARWPMGDPKGLDDPTTEPPPYKELCETTRAAYADLDASPTKAWMIYHRCEDAIQGQYEIGFGKRPKEELYDLREDPDHMCNLAEDPDYREVKERLCGQLMKVLEEQDDPRVTETPCRFEHPPFTDSI
jgi:uncharacterized sulfatase